MHLICNYSHAFLHFFERFRTVSLVLFGWIQSADQDVEDQSDDDQGLHRITGYFIRVIIE